MHLRVVLVQPLYEGNVGSVARAMKNFGFRDLVMVNPCRIEDYGLAMASHARDVLQMSRSYTRLGEAVAGANLVVGSTGKRLDTAQHHLRLHLRVPCLSPGELVEKLQGMEGTVALLLGREDCGLCSEELALCDMLISIPTSQEYPVMNLSHSAAVLFYELSRKKEQDCSSLEMARRESLDLLAERSRALLYEVRYPRHKVDYTLLMLRRILGRAKLTEREARALLGLIKNIRWRIETKDEGSEDGHKRESSEEAGQSAEE